MDRRFLLMAAVAAAVALIVPLGLSGCVTPASSGVTPVKPGRPLLVAVDPGTDESLTVAVNDFGLDLLAATASRPDDNAILSPVSVHAALSMTANGATGETAKQMRRVLRTDSMTATETNAQWASLLARLGSRSSDQTLEIANALWARKDIAFEEPFMAADRDFFGAQVSTLDFEKDDVAGVINGWVKKNTRGKITRIVDEVPEQAILYLTNAVYFKGDWKSPFTREGTWRQSFTRADGSKTDVDMMNTAKFLPYVANATLRATRMPYRGDAAAFYVILPEPGVSLETAMKSLEGTGFSEMRRTMASEGATEVILGLPKLDAETAVSLAKPLAAMGMPSAFDSKTAEFAGMADLNVPIWIDEVAHATKVKVDEKGTEAAAATSAGMSAGAAPEPATPPEIICDRPYLFAIVDEESGAMLFLGVVNDPNR